jgi:hypothetical protein
VGSIKRTFRDIRADIKVVTEDFGERNFPDLCQLTGCELEERIVGFVPEPVTLPESLELASNDTGHGGSNYSTVDRPLNE